VCSSDLAGRKNGPGFWEGTNKGNLPPDIYGDLGRFQAETKQELHGVKADPLLAGLGNGGYGRLPLPAYRMKAGSPALGAGKAVVLDEKWLAERAKFLVDTGAQKYGIPMAPDSQASMDYWEQKIGPNAPVSIGAEK
jgi:hypothetical protein